MEPQRIVAYLKKIPLFSELNDERGELALYHVAKVVQERTLKPGDWLFGQGDIVEGLMMIVKGQVRLTRVDRMGVTHQVTDQGPGTIFGENELLVGDFHDFTAMAIEPLQVLYIPRADFNAVYAEEAYLRRKLQVNADVQKRLDLPAFNWLRDDEWVILAVRRHWARVLRQITPPLLLVILLFPVFIGLMLSTQAIWKIIGLLLSIPLASFIGLVAWSYVNWRDDFFVLTTQRVAHIERVWPFKEQFAESPLDNIEDVYEIRPGLGANLLDYGSLVLQTAGETVQIEMEQVPQTSYLREIIFREIERSQAREILHSFGAIRETLAKRLEIHGESGLKAMPEAPPVASKVPWPTLVLGAIWEYFFPPAWQVSANGDTVIWRRFWAAGFVQHLKISIPLAALTLGGATFLLANATSPELPWMLLVWLFVETILFGILLWFIEDWRNDYFELTPTRMVLVMQKPLLLQESRKETILGNIQNISFQIPSILARMLDYGHVTLETAGTQGKFTLRWLRHPQKVQTMISKRRREYVQRQKEAEARQREEELLNWFATYDKLQQKDAETPTFVAVEAD